MSDETEGQQGLPEGETAIDESATIEAPETDTEQPEIETEEEAPKPKHKPWFQERIDQLTREKYDERRQVEALRAEVSQYRTQNPDQNAHNPDRQVEERAQAIVHQRQFDQKCNDVYSSGQTEFADFDSTLGNFRMLGGLPPTVLEAVTELPDAHKVLHALGSNMDEAARIFSLAPVPMAVALAKLSQSAPKAKPVSNAPAPIKPLNNAAPKGEKDPEDMNYAEWEAWRNADLAKRS